MSSDTLHRLLIDRTAGELSPDVAQLLDAYLRHDAAAARRGAEVDNMIALARRALAGDSAKASPLRPFPARRISRSQRRRRVLARLRPIALAACLVLAFAAGMRLDRPRPFEQTPRLAKSVEDSAPGFWSVTSARAALGRSDDVSYPKIRWSSPLRWPQPGGQS